MVPLAVMRPILSEKDSVNQRAPSEPVAMANGLEAAVGTGNSAMLTDWADRAAVIPSRRPARRTDFENIAFHDIAWHCGADAPSAGDPVVARPYALSRPLCRCWPLAPSPFGQREKDGQSIA